MDVSFAPSARSTRKKNPQYKRQHKATRIRALLEERKDLAKAASMFDRRVGRSTARIEAAFRGCELL